MKEQLASVGNIWTNLSFNQKIALGTLTIASALAIYFFHYQSQQDFDVMFSGLAESDAAAIVHNLRKEGVPYRLAENGTTILVPRRRKEDLRLGAFQEDLIKSDNTLGYGALSDLPFGLTDWQEQMYDKKIVSDEVETTLQRIAGIKKARVILAQPKDSVFSSERIAATASVLLIVEPGLRLKPEQVKTIKHLVAHSVPGLDPANVAISDSMGNSLTGESDFLAGNLGNGNDMDSLRRTFEKQKAKDILELLVPIVGPNNAVVKVNAVMNFDRSESRIKRFIPAGGTAEDPRGIPVSVQSSTERYKGAKASQTAAGEGGQPGVDSNIPTYAVDENTTESQNGDYNNEQVVTNYEISTEERTVVRAPGTVERMTIAVVVNKVLTNKQTEELNQLVASAAGVDINRGDSINISGLQFSPELKEAEEQSIAVLQQSNQNEMIIKLAQLAGVFILAVAALIVFYNLIKRPIEGELYDDMDHEPTYLPSGEDEEMLLDMPPVPALEAKLDPELEQMREAISGLVNKDPNEAARVLQTYMKDF